MVCATAQLVCIWGLNKQMHVSFNQQYKRYNERLLPEDIANEIPKFIEEMIN